jgi:hypothetical protein
MGPREDGAAGGDFRRAESELTIFKFMTTPTESNIPKTPDVQKPPSKRGGCLGWLWTWIDNLRITPGAILRRRIKNAGGLFVEALKRKKSFDSWTALSQEQKELIRDATMKVMSQQDSQNLERSSSSQRVVAAVQIIAIIAAFKLSPLLSKHVNYFLSTLNYPLPEYVYYAGVIVVIIIAVLIIIAIVFVVVQQDVSNLPDRVQNGILIWTLAAPVAIYGAIVVYLSRIIHINGHNIHIPLVIAESIIMDGLSFLLIILTYLFLQILIETLFEIVLLSWDTARNPSEAIIARLFTTIEMVEKQQEDWSNPNFQRKLMASLEYIAVNVERRIPYLVPSGDNATNAWMREQTEQISHTFRQWKKQIVLPNSKNRLTLLTNLGSAIVSVTTGNWDTLPKTTITTSKKEKLWIKHSWSILKSILTGGIIWGGVFVAHRIPSLHLSMDWAWLGLGFILLTLINIISPEVVANITAFKGVKDMMGSDKK